MKLRTFLFSVALSAIIAPASSAMASEVFDVWGTGYSYEDARQDIRNSGAWICTNAGYQNSWVEEVSVAHGGLVNIYGIVTCY